MVACESMSSETTIIEHISIDLIKESEGDREFKLERILEEPMILRFDFPAGSFNKKYL